MIEECKELVTLYISLYPLTVTWNGFFHTRNEGSPPDNNGGWNIIAFSSQASPSSQSPVPSTTE
jgi:hypothetical protein